MDVLVHLFPSHASFRPFDEMYGDAAFFLFPVCISHLIWSKNENYDLNAIIFELFFFLFLRQFL